MFRWIRYQQIGIFWRVVFPFFDSCLNIRPCLPRRSTAGGSIVCLTCPHPSSLLGWRKQEPWASLSSSSCLAPCILWSSIIPRWTGRCFTPRTHQRLWVAWWESETNRDEIWDPRFFLLGWWEGMEKNDMICNTWHNYQDMNHDQSLLLSWGTFVHSLQPEGSFWLSVGSTRSADSAIVVSCPQFLYGYPLIVQE